MRDDARDAALLLDMLQAARTVLRFTESRTREEYSNNDMLRAATEHIPKLIDLLTPLVTPPPPL